MNEKSDIKGVAFCTFAILSGLGAAAGCFFGAKELLAGDPKANFVGTLAAGGWCIFMIGSVVGYIKQRQSPPDP